MFVYFFTQFSKNFVEYAKKGGLDNPSYDRFVRAQSQICCGGKWREGTECVAKGLGKKGPTEEKEKKETMQDRIGEKRTLRRGRRLHQTGICITVLLVGKQPTCTGHCFTNVSQ